MMEILSFSAVKEKNIPNIHSQSYINSGRNLRMRTETACMQEYGLISSKSTCSMCCGFVVQHIHNTSKQWFELYIIHHLADVLSK